MNHQIVELWSKYGAQTTLSQAEELYNAVLNTLSGDVVEVGSATGGTTIVLIEAAKQVGKFVYSIDPYPEDIYTTTSISGYKEGFAKNILNGGHFNIVQYNQDLADCIDGIPDALSVVFIDGCHEFSFAKREYELLWPKLITGGLMYIHDIYWGEGQISLTPGTGLTGFREWTGKGEDIGNMLRIEK